MAVVKTHLLLPLLVAIGFGGYWFADFTMNSGKTVPASPHGIEYVSSQQCGACHPNHYKSWHRTYHRTMTAPATPENMKAPIQSTVDLSIQGYSVRFQRVKDSYYVDIPFSDSSYRRFQLLYTIGSRRMQQFAVQDGDRIYRLPVFYSLDRQQWMHINEAFFYKKSAGLNSFLQGYSIWNPNCIFCHNTRPDPGYDSAQKTFHSRVAETGIACEECHAPGEIHAAVNHNPLRRYIYSYSGRNDGTITNPKKLDQLRSVQVCGQCHGQRLPNPIDRIDDLMANGDPYVPGTNLLDFYKPLAHTDSLPGYKLFHLRFWRDGSPRLTAYEMQGVLASPCYQNSTSFSCVT